MNSIRGASVARNTPTVCAACHVNLAGEESHVAEWRPGVGLTYWCAGCDPRKERA